MSRVILALCLLTAVILVACIDTEEFDSGNMTAVDASHGLRIKRAACNTHKKMCYQFMCNRCCNGCKGFGCDKSMCRRCCA
uniref:Hepcidin n=1 Tax=Acrobeloides nanus TaxID=290746 RepID=A0A914CSR1_9BILA